MKRSVGFYLIEHSPFCLNSREEQRYKCKTYLMNCIYRPFVFVVLALLLGMLSSTWFLPITLNSVKYVMLLRHLSIREIFAGLGYYGNQWTLEAETDVLSRNVGD